MTNCNEPDHRENGLPCSFPANHLGLHWNETTLRVWGTNNCGAYLEYELPGEFGEWPCTLPHGHAGGHSNIIVGVFASLKVGPED